MSKVPPLPPEVIQEALRQVGKKGGRPRTLKHDVKDPRCRCADCRIKRGERGPKEKAKDWDPNA